MCGWCLWLVPVAGACGRGWCLWPWLVPVAGACDIDKKRAPHGRSIGETVGAYFCAYTSDSLPFGSVWITRPMAS
jgi:hypothetical protein